MPRWKRRSIREEIREDSQFSDEEDDGGFKADAVFSAVAALDVAALRKILDSGVNLDFSNKYDETPLHQAVKNDPTPAGMEMVDLLLFFGCLPKSQDRFGETALHVAANKHPEYVERLLDAGAPVNLRDNAGRTALMLACGSDSELALMTIQCLLDRGASVYYKDGDGQTALHYICRNYSLYHLDVKMEIMYTLLYAGLDVNSPDHAGFPPSIYVYMGQHAIKAPRSDQLEPDNSKLVNIIIRGGANCLKDQLDNLRRHSSTGFRNFCFFLVLDYTIFKNVTSLLTYKLLHNAVSELTLQHEDKKIKEFSEFLKSEMKNVRTLKELSRFVVRERLQGKVLRNVTALGLPKYLENYVTFSDGLKV